MKALERIIYVDDEDDIREVASIALEAVGGFQLATYSGGQQLLAEKPAAPDLFLLDVMMPGIDGPSLLHALRALPAYAKVPVVFMTAKVQPNEVSALMDHGAIGIVAKPFDPMKLADELQMLWARAGA